MRIRFAFAVGAYLIVVGAEAYWFFISQRGRETTTIPPVTHSESRDSVVFRQSGRAVHMTFPADWKRVTRNGEVQLLTHDEPRGIFGVTIAPTTSVPVSLPLLNLPLGGRERAFQKHFLRALRALLRTDVHRDRKWIGDEIRELIGVPVLVITVLDGERVTRELHLTRGEWYYTLTFLAENQPAFDALWPTVERAIHTLEFR